MPPQRERISRSEFTHFYATGIRHHSPYAMLIVVPYPTRKLAVVVSKKVSKSAVVRNTLRRRLYPILGKESGSQHTWILILKPTASQLTRHDLQSEVCTLIGRVRKKQ